MNFVGAKHQGKNSEENICLFEYTVELTQLSLQEFPLLH